MRVFFSLLGALMKGIGIGLAFAMLLIYLSARYSIYTDRHCSEKTGFWAKWECASPSKR